MILVRYTYFFNVFAEFIFFFLAILNCQIYLFNVRTQGAARHMTMNSTPKYRRHLTIPFTIRQLQVTNYY